MSRLRTFRKNQTPNRRSNESVEESTKRFVVTVFQNNIEDKTLGLPSKFVREYGDELSDIVKLIDPKGHVWQVDLTKGKNNVWFDGDWDEFVKYHSIGDRYKLVFKYKGKYKGISNFSVFIFDRSSCEIQYLRNEPSNDVEEPINYSKNDTEPDNLTASERPLKKLHTSKKNMARRSADSGHQRSKKRRHGHCSVPKENARSEPECPKRSQKFVVKEEAGLTDSEDDVNEHEINDIDVALQGIITSRNFTGQYMEATIETKRAVKKACASKPRNGSFLVILQASNVQRGTNYLYFPAEFTRKYLQDPGKYVKFQLSDGKEYSVSIHQENHARRAISRLTSGWVEFGRDNDLKIGDVCLFELKPSPAVIVLKASIFRASDFN